MSEQEHDEFEADEYVYQKELPTYNSEREAREDDYSDRFNDM